MTKTKMPRNAGYDGMATVHTVRLPLWPYLVTPIGAVGLAAGAAGAHAMWAGAPGWPAAGLTLAGVGLTALTWRAAAARGIVRQAVSTVSCVAGSVWTLGATLSAPWSRPWLDMWLIGAPTASIAMAIVRIMRSGSTGEPGEQPAIMGGLADRVKELRDVKFSAAKVVGGKAVSEVTTAPGATFGELASAREELASVLDVPASAVRTIESPDSARRGRVEVVPVDQLREMIPYPGPSHPGGSMADPIVLGRVEDAEPLLLYLPGDPKAGRNSTHVGVVGMSGAGKTEVILRIAEEVLTRRDGELWVGDARKAGQLPAWLLDGAARVATTEPDVDELLDDLLDDVAQRSAQMGGHGHKQWTKGCPKCPRYRVVILDEAAQVAAGNRIFVDLAESLRSVGVALVVGLQRASHDRFPTSARSNIGAWICLGVLDATDAEMALSEETLAAGAMPWRWKNMHPGYLYAEVPGVEPARWALQARGFAPPPSEDDRARAIAAATGKAAPEPAAAPSSPATSAATVEVEDQGDEPPVDDEPNAAWDPTDPPDDVDPAQPVTVPPGMPRIPLADDREPLRPEEAQRVLRQHLIKLAEAGTTVVKPADLGEVLYVTGLGGDWLRKHLTRLTLGSQPLLRRVERGYYEVLLPEREHVG